MKAWVLHRIGDIRYEEVEQPILKENEVLTNSAMRKYEILKRIGEKNERRC